MPAVIIPDQFDSDEEDETNVPRENHIVTQVSLSPPTFTLILTHWPA
jgi:hypothetical protein